ncbi:hypothetical protein [Solirubrobacter soli]|uniref:hypothetical protein n=1 Tax=Solirubrobacter soli TaxID=363832 RepID=UPI0004004F62|nr:hypothetical protein [Solirubrobacter soli]
MTGHRQPWYLDRLRAELERVAAIEDRRERGPGLGRLRPVLGRLRPLVALAVVAALFAVVLTVARESDVERPAVPPGKKLVATDVERGVRFSLDGRVLTVQLLPNRPNATFEAVSGAEISATCGTNVAAPSGDPRSEITVFRRWPAGQTSLSYRFPRDVSSWCRLDRQSVGIVASVSFPVAWSGARRQIAETANNWARVFASTEQACNAYTAPSVCKQIGCQLVGGKPTEACKAWLLPASSTPSGKGWAWEHRGATVQKIAMSGDRAAATLSKDGLEIDTVQLRRTATGEWLIDKLGPIGAVGSSK